MKAVRYSQFGGPEVLEIVELPDPHAGAGQVRVAVRAAGINPSDWKLRSGMTGRGLPQTTGREVAGVVDELGEGIVDVAVGDRVFGFSDDGAGAAELALLSYYAPIPPSLEFPEAAGLPVAVETATRTQQRGRWPRGPRAQRDRRADRVRALLASGRADLPARTGRRGAPGERGRSRAREARAAGRLSAPRRRHAGDCSAVRLAWVPPERRRPGPKRSAIS
jgi:hypothetical protein